MSVMVGTDKVVNGATKRLTDRSDLFEPKCEKPCLQMVFFQLCRYNKKKNYDDVLN